MCGFGKGRPAVTQASPALLLVVREQLGMEPNWWQARAEADEAARLRPGRRRCPGTKLSKLKVRSPS